MNRFRQILAGRPGGGVTAETAPAPTTAIERRHPYDPRPDLDDPGRLWATVLATAYAAYGLSDIYTFLQGLRILECRLFIRQDGKLQLDTKPALEAGWNELELRQEWLMPQKDQIKDIFARAEAILAGLPPGMRVPAWMRRTG